MKRLAVKDGQAQTPPLRCAPLRGILEMNLRSAMRQSRRTLAAVAVPADCFARTIFSSKPTAGRGADYLRPSLGTAATTSARRADAQSNPPEVVFRRLRRGCIKTTLQASQTSGPLSMQHLRQTIHPFTGRVPQGAKRVTSSHFTDASSRPDTRCKVKT